MVALDWARWHPDRAAALVIEDSSMRRGGPGVDQLFDGWIALSKMSFKEARAYYANENAGWTDDDLDRRALAITSVAPGVFCEMKGDMVSQGGASAIATYTGIQSPTLLIYGDVDTGGMVPEFDAKAFSETLPNVEIARIPEGTTPCIEIPATHFWRSPNHFWLVMPLVRPGWKAQRATEAIVYGCNNCSIVTKVKPADCRSAIIWGRALASCESPPTCIRMMSPGDASTTQRSMI